MLQLKKSTGGESLVPDQKVIKAEEYAAKVDAEQILAAARKEAEAILASAHDALEKERAKGLQKGMDEGRAKIAAHMMETMGKAVSYFQQIEDRVVEIVISALRRILGEFDQRELVVLTVKRALQLFRNQKQVTVRISPAQEQILRAELTRILAEFPGVDFIDVVADARLESGGCILETPLGSVDASLNVQIDAIHKALLKTMRGAQAAEELPKSS